eukprot:EG_transcript_6008
MVGVPKPVNNTRGEYQHAQFLGFNIHTTPDATRHFGAFRAYVGLHNIDQDIRARVNVLERALDAIYNSSKWDRSPTTLKVFMAPEFFFRGPDGAYRVQPLLEGSLRLGQLLEALFQQKRWEHWLFVPGTVVAAEQVGRRRDKKMLYFNVAPIYKGASTKKYLHFKETIATIDFLEMNATEEEDVIPKPAGRTYSDLPDWMDRHLNKAGFEYVENNVFTMSGLRIGIEICADHGGSTLAGKQNGTVHLQLIVSGGMSIAKGSVVTPLGGPVFLVDGFGRTEVARNLFGSGLQYFENAEQGKDLFNVGPVHWSGLYSSLRRWLARMVQDMTGIAGTLPIGYAPASEGLHQVTRINALGPDWKRHIDGLFITKPYEFVTRAYEVLHRDLQPIWEEYIHKKRNHGLPIPRPPAPPATYPTVDCYPPMQLVELTPRRLP